MKESPLKKQKYIDLSTEVVSTINTRSKTLSTIIKLSDYEKNKKDEIIEIDTDDVKEIVKIDPKKKYNIFMSPAEKKLQNVKDGQQILINRNNERKSMMTSIMKDKPHNPFFSPDNQMKSQIKISQQLKCNNNCKLGQIPTCLPSKLDYSESPFTIEYIPKNYMLDNKSKKLNLFECTFDCCFVSKNDKTYKNDFISAQISKAKSHDLVKKLEYELYNLKNCYRFDDLTNNIDLTSDIEKERECFLSSKEYIESIETWIQQLTKGSDYEEILFENWKLTEESNNIFYDRSYSKISKSNSIYVDPGLKEDNLDIALDGLDSDSLKNLLILKGPLGTLKSDAIKKLTRNIKVITIDNSVKRDQQNLIDLFENTSINNRLLFLLNDVDCVLDIDFWPSIITIIKNLPRVPFVFTCNSFGGIPGCLMPFLRSRVLEAPIIDIKELALFVQYKALSNNFVLPNNQIQLLIRLSNFDSRKIILELYSLIRLSNQFTGKELNPRFRQELESDFGTDNLFDKCNEEHQIKITILSSGSDYIRNLFFDSNGLFELLYSDDKPIYQLKSDIIYMNKSHKNSTRNDLEHQVEMYDYLSQMDTFTKNYEYGNEDLFFDLNNKFNSFELMNLQLNDALDLILNYYLYSPNSNQSTNPYTLFKKNEEILYINEHGDFLAGYFWNYLDYSTLLDIFQYYSLVLPYLHILYCKLQDSSSSTKLRNRSVLKKSIFTSMKAEEIELFNRFNKYQ